MLGTQEANRRNGEEAEIGSRRRHTKTGGNRSRKQDEVNKKTLKDER